MRWIVTLIIIAVLGYGAYIWFSAPPPPTGAPEEAAAEAEPAGGGGAAPEQGAAVQAPAAPVPAGEERQLRRRLEKGTASTADRLRLAAILLADEDPVRRDEAVGLLRAVYRAGGAGVERAAAELLRRTEGKEQLAYASYLTERGAGGAGYGEACLVLGRSLLERREDSARVAAWEHLSRAYFSSDDPRWREDVRADLDPLVKDLLLSPRITKACATYTVVAGDTLGKIARAHNTTIRALEWLNQIENASLIHPGQRLKILSGSLEIEVDKSAFRLDLRLDGKYLLSAAVGLGEYGKTPIGEFVVDVIQKHPAWQREGHPPIPYGDPANPLGECWLGFRNTERDAGYGIHGTDQPETIGVESSQGCIRMRNEEVMLLYRLVPRGTKVRIRE